MSQLSVRFSGVLTSHNEISKTEQHPGAEAPWLCQLCRSQHMEPGAFIGGFLRMSLLGTCSPLPHPPPSRSRLAV